MAPRAHRAAVQRRIAECSCSDHPPLRTPLRCSASLNGAEVGACTVGAIRDHSSTEWPRRHKAASQINQRAAARVHACPRSPVHERSRLCRRVSKRPCAERRSERRSDGLWDGYCGGWARSLGEDAHKEDGRVEVRPAAKSSAAAWHRRRARTRHASGKSRHARIVHPAAHAAQSTVPWCKVRCGAHG